VNDERIRIMKARPPELLTKHNKQAAKLFPSNADK